MAKFPSGVSWPPPDFDRLLASPSTRTVPNQANRPLSIYVHVPFCSVRCGYCDFNTYTAEFGPGADRLTYAESVVTEIELSRQWLIQSGSLAHDSGTLFGNNPHLRAQTVFFGGGTPTLLSPTSIGQILVALQQQLGVAEDAEITVEANPETVTESSLRQLKESGVNRISVGMQSGVARVLRTLDRQHDPQSIPRVARLVKNLEMQLSFDLIYGTPGESMADWQESVRQVVALQPDHISIYSLIVEEGTKLGARISRGELPPPDDDDAAEKYEWADRALAEAGYKWYEISNYARQTEPDDSGEVDPRHKRIPKLASRHNLAYWRDWNWWGYGAGAHSHLGNTRWWNVKHPLTYANRVDSGELPVHQGEILETETVNFERLMLGMRTSEGISFQTAEAVNGSPENTRKAIAALIDQALVEKQSAGEGQIILTRSGRLMADYVTRVLAQW